MPRKLSAGHFNCEQYKEYRDQLGMKVYITNDGQWKWDVGESLWIELTPAWSGIPLINQPAVNQNQERTVTDMYIFTISAVRLTSVLEQQQGKSSEILATGQILAKEQNTAVAIFGAQNAEVLKKVSGDLLQIHVRQGV